MEVQLTSDQKDFARRAVESGRLQSEEDAVQQALASLARGEGREITPQSMQALSSEIKEQGRARLLAELAQAS
jgi:Arc/MetJ-type ribon-helix-helix transcriptional regulator